MTHLYNSILGFHILRQAQMVSLHGGGSGIGMVIYLAGLVRKSSVMCGLYGTFVQVYLINK
jgi:hypothetical protein